MSVTTDILETYRAPGRVVARLLARGPREDRALAILMGAALLMFVARTPGMARAAHFDPSVPLDARLGIGFFASLFLFPPIAYLIAGLSHLALRLVGGRGSYAGARLALFWALLAAAPAVLFQGLVIGFVDNPGTQTGVGIAVFALFLWFWLSGLRVAEFGVRAHD